MRIYLAARYCRNEELREYRDQLEELGHSVTSRWIDLHGGTELNSMSAEDLEKNPAAGILFAYKDLEDLRNADTVISFTGTSGSVRHAEFGVALALGKRMIIVGPREHIFHMLTVEVYPDWEALIDAWYSANVVGW
jgi:nucleoside 2-deoxyribosyltransferase